jgi:hypothetical protein
MSLHPWRHSLLAVALVLAGCKSNNPAPATTADANVAAAPTPNKAPTPVPASGPMLSYLKRVDSQKCEWVRRPISSGEATTVFSFDADCTRSEVSWSPDGKEGLVFTWPVGEGARPRVWRVDFAAKTGKPMELKGLPGGASEQGPNKPYIEKVGFDAQGRPVVLVSDVYTDRPLEKGKNGEEFISFEGERFPVREKKVDTSPGLALAYRWEGSEWKRFETKLSVYEAEEAPGINALDAAKALSYVQTPTPPTDLPGKEASMSSGRLLDSSMPEQQETVLWMTLTTPGGMLHYRASNPGNDTLVPTTPVRWEQDGKLAELEGLKAKDGDSIGLQVRGDLLLVTVLNEARPAYVFDTRTKKNLLSVEGVESAALWPEPTRP